MYSFYNKVNHHFTLKKKKPGEFPTIPSGENDICLNHAKLAPVGAHMMGAEKQGWSFR